MGHEKLARSQGLTLMQPFQNTRCSHIMLLWRGRKKIENF